MRKKNLLKGMSCLLAVSLLINPLQISTVKAANDYTLDYEETVVSVHIDGNDIVSGEKNSFSMYRADGSEIARWNYGQENQGLVASGNGRNISKYSSTLIRSTVNHLQAINDSDLREIKNASFYSRDGYGKLSNLYLSYDSNSPTSSFYCDSQYTYLAEYQYFGKDPIAKYTIPAGKIYMANLASQRNYSKAEINGINYKITGSRSKPLIYQFNEGEYEIGFGTYGSGEVNAYGSYSTYSYDHATNYHKVTINLPALYPKYFAQDGSLYTDLAQKANGSATAPLGYSSYTIEGKSVQLEAALCVTSGAFIQVPELDDKGNASFFIESSSRTATIATFFTRTIGGVRTNDSGSSFTYVDYDEKTVELHPQQINLNTDFVIQGLPVGSYFIRQTASDSKHTPSNDLAFTVTAPGKVQTINYVLKDKAFSLDPASQTPAVSSTSTPQTTNTSPTTSSASGNTGTGSATSTQGSPSNTTSSGSSTNQSSDSQIWYVEEGLLFDSNIDKREKELSPFSKLQLRLRCSLRSGMAVNTLSWKKVSGAEGYIIYGSKSTGTLEKLATVSSSNTYWSRKDLSKDTYYRYVVAAYKNGSIIATSKTVHGIAGSKKYSNPSKITGLKKSITLKKGTSKSLKAKVSSEKNLKVKNHVSSLRYESSNSKVVSVSKSGKLKAKAKGKATIYVYAQNGICKKVSVKVK